MQDLSASRDCAFSAFITNLGKYNEGYLIGEWVKFPVTNEELQAVFQRIGINRRYEEWFITDYECPDSSIYDLLGEYESLSELNYLAGQIMELDESEEFWQAVLDLGENTGSIKELINLTENMDCFDYLSVWKAITTSAITGLNKAAAMIRAGWAYSQTISTMRVSAGIFALMKAAYLPITAMCVQMVVDLLTSTTARLRISPKNTVSKVQSYMNAPLSGERKKIWSDNLHI